MRKLLVAVGLNLSKYFKDLNWAKAGAKAFGKDVANGVATGFVSEKILGAFRKDANRELAAAERDVVSRGVSLKRKLAGAFSAGAVLAVGNASVQSAKRYKDFMDQTGRSADEVQQADNAMKRNGQTMESFVSKLDAINEARKDAVENNPGLRDTFRDFGVTLDDLRNPLLSNLDLAKKMGVALSGMQVTEEQRNSLREIFGKGGEQFLTALKGFGEKSPLDIFASESAIQNIDRANNLIAQIWQNVKNIGTNLIGAGLGKLFSFADGQTNPNLSPARQAELGVVRTAGRFIDTVTRGAFSGMGGTSAAEQEITHRDRIAEMNRRTGRAPLIARDSGQFFGPDAGEFRGRQMFKLKEEKELGKLAADLAEAQRKTDFERLSRLEKEKKLRAEITGLLDAADWMDQSGFAVPAAEARVEAEKKQLELDNLQRQSLPGFKAGYSPDDLARNNRFIGGEGGDFALELGLQVQRDQLAVLKNIDRKLTPPAANGNGNAVGELNREFD